MILGIAVLMMAVVGCSDDDENNPMTNNAPTMDIVETAAAAGNFKTLLAAAEAADLVDALKGEGPLTVFAPTDEAFDALPAGTVEALLADIDALTAILTYHVAVGEYPAETVVNSATVPTLNGAELTVTVTEDGKVKVDDAFVTITDIQTTNGIIHVIDGVVIPNSTAGKLYSSADFAAGGYSFGGGWIANAIREGRFGWLTKRLPLYYVARLAGLSTLTTAVKAADLRSTLVFDGPFTVFAPTNEAFGALPPGTVESLLMDPPALANILLYHVTPGKVTSDIVVTLDGQNANMVNGGTVGIIIDGGVKLDDTGTDVDKNVIYVDIMARNGVIHIIDNVLLP
jgi:uncharacterized surface protein with fasciclin (FAS1) repeats